MNHESPSFARATGALLLLLAAAGQADAGGCSVSSSGLAFGPYQPLTFPGRLNSAAVTSDASVTVVCTGIVTGGAYTIALGPGLAGDGDRISTRYLANGAGGPEMAFNVYREPNYSTIWGDGITAGNVLSGTIPQGDSNQSYTVYGRVPEGQSTLRAGNFSVTLTMTVSYSP
jgi:spore coat protein U-like protein